MQDITEKTRGQLSNELNSLHLQLKNIAERDNLLFERNLAFSVIIKPDCTIEDANKTFLINLGYSKSEILGQPLINFIVEDQRKNVLSQFEKFFKGEEPSELEVGIYVKDGSIKTILLSSIQFVFQGEENSHSIIVSGVDITVHKKSEEKLVELHKNTSREKQKLEEVLGIDQRISAILKLDHLIDFIIEKSTQVLDAQRCSLMFLDMDKQELVIKGAKGLSDDIIKSSRVKFGEPIAGLVAQDSQPRFVANIETDPSYARKNRSAYKGKSFLSVPIKLHDLLIGVLNVSEKGPQGEGVFTQTDLKILEMIVHQGAIAIENANHYRELEYLSTTDFLTGLFNYRYFMRALKQEIDRSVRHSNQICLLMFDVDDFKSYNDTFGHLEGDHALKEIARSLKESLRKLDIICRYAGDEFVIIIPETDLVEAKVVVEKIQTAVSKLQLKRKITLSMGLSSYHKNNDVRDFIRKADQALYQAKKEGKDGVCCLP